MYVIDPPVGARCYTGVCSRTLDTHSNTAFGRGYSVFAICRPWFCTTMRKGSPIAEGSSGAELQLERASRVKDATTAGEIDDLPRQPVIRSGGGAEPPQASASGCRDGVPVYVSGFSGQPV